MNRPFSPKQELAFTNSNALINIAEGAVSSGKSYIYDYTFLNFLRQGPNGPEGEDGDYLISGKSEGSIIRNILSPIEKEFGLDLNYNHSQRFFNLWDKKVYVIGANDERAEGKIRGWTLAGALLDELSLIPQNFFNMCISRLRIKNARLFATTNPDSKYHWLKTDVLDKFADDPKMLARFQFTLDDNPNLDETYKENLKKAYSGLWYRRFILGEWVQAEGAIYDFFDSDKHVIKSPRSYAKYYFLGVDYGTKNSFAAVLIGYNDDAKPALWVEKEYYWDSKVTGYQKTGSDYANDLQREFGNYPIRHVYIDPAAASFEVELRRLKWPVLHAKNDVLQGIQCVSNLLSEGNLVICENCTNVLKEIESYVWDEKSVKLGEDRPLKQRDHALDAMRYVLYSFFGNKTSLKEISREEAYLRSESKKFQQNPMAYPGYVNSFGWQKY